MTIEELKKVFDTNKEVNFKIYSLDYIIKIIDDKVAIYPTIYETRKSLYNYLIYGETLLENENRIMK